MLNCKMERYLSQQSRNKTKPGRLLDTDAQDDGEDHADREGAHIRIR